jgi:hypothetical protein
MLVVRKPVPLTVSVREAEPAVTVVGAIEVIAGTGGLLPPSPPLEFPDEPPQPASIEVTPRHENKTGT